MLDQNKINRVRGQLLSPWKFKMFLLQKLPMGFLSGMRIKELNDDQCTVQLKYRWLVKNPFKSTFWAVMGMAGEMTTGAMLVSFTEGQSPRVSFILIGQSAKYLKKAKGDVRYVCSSGALIRSTIEDAAEDGEKHPLDLPVKVYNESNDLIAEMTFQWVLQRR